MPSNIQIKSLLWTNMTLPHPAWGERFTHTMQVELCLQQKVLFRIWIYSWLFLYMHFGAALLNHRFLPPSHWGLTAACSYLKRKVFLSTVAKCFLIVGTCSLVSTLLCRVHWECVLWFVAIQIKLKWIIKGTLELVLLKRTGLFLCGI